MTGYQKCKVIALWIKAGKPMPLDEFAATVDVSNFVLSEQRKDTKVEPKDPMETITKIFPGAVPLRVK